MCFRHIGSAGSFRAASTLGFLKIGVPFPNMPVLETKNKTTVCSMYTYIYICICISCFCIGISICKHKIDTGRKHILSNGRVSSGALVLARLVTKTMADHNLITRYWVQGAIVHMDTVRTAQYIFKCRPVHVHIYICIYTAIFLYMHAPMHVHVYICVYIFIYPI